VKKEWGDSHNLIAVIMHEHNFDAQEAIDHAALLFSQKCQEFIDVAHSFPRYPMTEFQQRFQYIRGLAAMVTGTIEWRMSANAILEIPLTL
jgi:hypothetical protein